MVLQCGHSLCPDGAAAHNAAPPPKRNLDSIYTRDEIYARIADNTFRDLFIGDYFDINISTSFTANETIRCMLSHFNYYWNCGDTAFRTPHVVITPLNCFTVANKMNETNTTEGGYANSYMHKIVLPEYERALRTVFGNHLLAHEDLFTNATNATTPSMAGTGLAGASSGWVWCNTTLCLMSEIQVYGTTVWSSSGYDTGIANRQLALFKHDPAVLVCKLGGTDDVTASNRVWWWLHDVASSTYFAHVNSSGLAGYGSASVASGVRPLFCIG